MLFLNVIKMGSMQSCGSVDIKYEILKCRSVEKGIKVTRNHIITKTFNFVFKV